MSTAREKMKAHNAALGTSSLDSADSSYARTLARVEGERALRNAKRTLQAFGSPRRYADALSSKKFPSAAQKSAAAKLARAATLVSTKVDALTAVLSENSSIVEAISRAQGELSEAEAALQVAQEAAESVRETDAKPTAKATNVVDQQDALDLAPYDYERRHALAFERFKAREVAAGRA